MIKDSRLPWGITLLFFGVLFFFRQIGVFTEMMEEYIFDWRNILLVFGIVFLIFHNNKSIGIVLLAVWALFYLKDIIDFSREISEFIWPALLIIAGGFLIYNSNTKKNDKQQLTKQDENNNHTPLTQ